MSSHELHASSVANMAITIIQPPICMQDMPVIPSYLHADPEVELMQRGELEYIRNQRELERVLGSCNPSRTHSRAVSASGRPEGSTQHTHNARLLPTPPSLGLPQALTVSNDSEGDDGSSSDSGTGSDGAFSPHVKFMLPPDTLYSPVDPADDSQPYYFGSSPLDDANSSNILHQRPSLGLGAGPRAPSWMMQAGQHHKQRDEGVSVLGAKVKEAMEKVEGTRPQDLPKEVGFKLPTFPARAQHKRPSIAPSAPHSDDTADTTIIQVPHTYTAHLHQHPTC